MLCLRGIILTSLYPSVWCASRPFSIKRSLLGGITNSVYPIYVMVPHPRHHCRSITLTSFDWGVKRVVLIRVTNYAYTVPAIARIQ